LAVGLILLFIVSIVAPMTLGHDINNTTDKRSVNNSDDFAFRRFDKYFFPESYSSEKNRFEIDVSNVTSEVSTFSKEATESHSTEKIGFSQRALCTSPMDSPWPMHGHDVHHTGRSPCSTVDTWAEIWRFGTSGWAMSSPSIDNDETIYIGAHNFYAVYPNGTLKWMYNTGGVIESCCPAIDENGVIYVGTEYGDPNYLYAFYPNGTLKWKYPVSNVYTSPTITNDGTIIFADSDNWNIIALNSNGTQKWGYHTNMVIYSSPAIGLDGTIYCGSHDCNVYALYPNNGTLKWKFTTGNWVHGSPTIGDDGTVYIGSDDGYLYALYPNNGTMKWQCHIGESYASPALGIDGTLYIGVWEKTFYAIYPNGTIKWSFNTGGGKVWGSSPALSSDGTIYFGTCDLEWTGGVEIIALYTDGTVKWRKGLDTVFSSPAIGSDGTVYIGSCSSDNGYLNAFGTGPLEAEANGPYYSLINQPVQFKGSSSGGYSPHSYHWDFGDSHTSDEQNPTHIYANPGNYTVILTVTDNTSNTSSDTSWAWIQATNTPPNKPTINGPTKGEYGISYDYKFVSADPDGTPIWYYVDWGDNSNTGWFGPYSSNEEVVKSHFWYDKGTYTISCKAKDPYNAEGEWGTLSVTMPCSYDKPIMNFLEKILERFPHAFPILRYILGQYKTFF
jgi:outer membrane protein assembly factor BamB